MAFKYIKKIGEKLLYSDGAGKVELYDFSRVNENEEAREEAVATVASICYGKPAKDAKKLVKRLWTESGGLPSSAFEFIRGCDDEECCDASIEASLRNWHKLPTDEDYERKTGWSIKELQEAHKTVVATFRIKVPVFVARQVLRHRTFSPQELSRRYVDDQRVPLVFWLPEEEEVGEVAMMLFKLAYSVEEWIYKALRRLKVRAEIARAVLGTGLYTEFWLMGDVLAWQNYFKLRTDSHAQKEHRMLAAGMLGLLEQHQPELYKEVKP